MVGVGSTLAIFFLPQSKWQAVYPYAEEQPYCEASSDDCPDDNESGPDRWYWARRLIAMEDSAAQWIMMTFTVVAAGLLLATLRATQSMSYDTTRIGGAQTKAYIVISKAEVVAKNQSWMVVQITIKNTGMTPARKLLVSFEVTPFAIMDQPTTSTPQTTYDLGSGSEYTFEHSIGKPSGLFEAQAWRESDDSMSVNGEVVFQTIFGKTDTVKFEFFCTAEGFVDGKPLELKHSESNRG